MKKTTPLLLWMATSFVSFTASYAQTPIVVTSNPSYVSSGAATLVGSVDRNGATGQVAASFEYGTTTSFGMTAYSAPSNIPSGGPVQIIGNLSSLASSTTYYFRAIATTSNGTVVGQTKSFTTQPYSAPSVTCSHFHAPGNTYVVFNAEVNPNNSETTVKFEYGPTTAYGYTLTEGSGPFNGYGNNTCSETAYGLLQNTTYYWRTKATNFLGTTYCNGGSFSTAASSSVNDLFAASGYTLVPNPASEKIVLGTGRSVKDIAVAVIDIFGRSYKVSASPSTAGLEIDIKDLKAGSYWLCVSEQGQKSCAQFRKD